MMREFIYGKTVGALTIFFVLGYAGLVFSSAIPTHMDNSLLPKGCFTCHSGGHGMRGSAMLRKDAAQVCLGCHDKNAREQNIHITPRTSIRDVQNKFSHHPVEDSSSPHRKGEGIGTADTLGKRHADCGDCHDPHWSTQDKPYARVDGINSFGVRVPEAAKEYEICYKCHADSPNLPKKEKNKRMEFNKNNPSFHPVEAKGRVNSVPSLIFPNKLSSIITCTNCHNNNDPLGPKGPHGSDYSPLLVLNYGTKDGFQESTFQYALCYKCHDRQSILGNKSFPQHNLHVVKVKASCYACHTSHGSQINTHLIHFNPEVVGLPSNQQNSTAKSLSTGGAVLKFSALPVIDQSSFNAGSTDLGRYVDFGNGHGQCFLTCHGKQHNPASY